MSAAPESPPAGRPSVEVTVDEASVAVTVLEAVAAVTDSTPTDLPSLHDAVDPDALNAAVRSFGSAGRVAFPYAGCTVVVDGDGAVAVYAGGTRGSRSSR
ncbi:MAG: HalOD1 output domain-containing protein [Haloferacaceae archaeon]